MDRSSGKQNPLATRLANDGFLLLDELFAPQALSAVRDALLRQFQSGSEQASDRILEIGSREGSILEINRPTTRDAALAESSVLKDVIRYSQQIFGHSVFSDFDHAILKPPQSGSPTAWHQDEVYHPLSSPNGRAMKRLHWWIPLQDTAANNGGMVYVPCSHLQGLRPHRSVASKDGAIRRVLEPTETDVVEASVRLGGAAIHLPRTIHMARPNASNEARLAWIIHIRSGSPTLDVVRYGFHKVVDRCFVWARKRSAAAR